MELAAEQKSARVRHAQPWSAERGLQIQQIQLPTVVTVAGTNDNSTEIDAPSAHERSRT
jgi:hypothetical protein